MCRLINSANKQRSADLQNRRLNFLMFVTLLQFLAHKNRLQRVANLIVEIAHLPTNRISSHLIFEKKTYPD